MILKNYKSADLFLKKTIDADEIRTKELKLFNCNFNLSFFKTSNDTTMASRKSSSSSHQSATTTKRSSSRNRKAHNEIIRDYEQCLEQVCVIFLIKKIYRF